MVDYLLTQDQPLICLPLMIYSRSNTTIIADSPTPREQNYKNIYHRINLTLLATVSLRTLPPFLEEKGSSLAIWLYSCLEKSRIY